jgi:hypothetical protein
MYRVNLTKSARDFIKLVWPTIRQYFNNCKIRHMETVTTVTFCRELDQEAGIDAWTLDTERGMRGIASRVQWNINYRTFTIRKERESGAKTEFEKRLYAIRNDWLYPFYTVQAYISIAENKRELLSVAWCKTKDLIEYIEEGALGEDYYIKTVDNNGKADFFVVPWKKFHQIYSLEEWHKTGGYIKYISSLIKQPSPESQSLEYKKLSDFF